VRASTKTPVSLPANRSPSTTTAPELPKPVSRRAPPPQTRPLRRPDAQWIRREIAVADVARKLGLEGDGWRFDCFRHHPFGKRKRSLSVHHQSNTIRCFTCDDRSMSPIDLVAKVNGCGVGAAILWIGERFPGVPTVELRLKRRSKTYVRRQTQTLTVDTLVRSPGWAALSLAAKAVITAILARTPAAGSEQYSLRCSYEALRKWTGVRSEATIARALRELTNAQAIHKGTVPTGMRTQRGFWTRQLLIRVSQRALHAGRPRRLIETLPTGHHSSSKSG
jgi:hypothetical protein